VVSDLDEAYASCEQIARAHYENFPVASLLLPRPLRRHVAAVYAFARAADDFADENTWSAQQRYDLLDGWLARLRSAESSRQPGPGPRPGEPAGAPLIFHALGATIRDKRLPLSPFEDLLSAFRQDVGVRRYATWDDVLDYSRRSANPVGRLVLRIAGYEDARLDSWADAVCTALQLTNFWQDVKPDFERGRVYLPQQQAAAYAADEADLSRAETTRPWRLALAAAVARTRALYEAGRPLCDALSGRLRLELRATWLGGIRILNRIEHQDFDVLSRRPRLGPLDFGWMAWRVATWVPR
jgi:squalene synthase HpnC